MSKGTRNLMNAVIFRDLGEMFDIYAFSICSCRHSLVALLRVSGDSHDLRPYKQSPHNTSTTNMSFTLASNAAQEQNQQQLALPSLLRHVDTNVAISRPSTEIFGEYSIQNARNHEEIEN